MDATNAVQHLLWAKLHAGEHRTFPGEHASPGFGTTLGQLCPTEVRDHLPPRGRIHRHHAPISLGFCPAGRVSIMPIGHVPAAFFGIESESEELTPLDGSQ